MSLRGDASQRPGCGPAAPPRFRSAGRAFTVTVPTSDIPCHSQAPTRRLHCFRPPAAALRASTARRVGFTCRVRVVPPSPLNERVILPLKRGWRNDSGCLPSCQISRQLALCLESISAPRSRRLATPDKTEHHAASLTIWRDARVPFRSDTAVMRRLCQAPHRLRAVSSARSSPSLDHRRLRQQIRRFATS